MSDLGAMMQSMGEGPMGPPKGKPPMKGAPPPPKGKPMPPKGGKPPC